MTEKLLRIIFLNEFKLGHKAVEANRIINVHSAKGPQLTVYQIAERLDSSYGTVFRHLKKFGILSKFG